VQLTSSKAHSTCMFHISCLLPPTTTRSASAGQHMETAHSMVVMLMLSFSRTAHTLQDELTSVVKATEVNLARRPTGYIPTPANANFALWSDAVRGQLKVLHPATRWSRGGNPIGRNAMKTRETWNTDGIL